MDVCVRWRAKLKCWRLLSLSDRARDYLRTMGWPAPIDALDVTEDEGCEMLHAMQNRGFNVVFEKITRTRKRRQRNTA